MLKFSRLRQSQWEHVRTALRKYNVESLTQERLITFWQTAAERELYRTNPRLIGDRLHLSEHDTLKLLVVALREGWVSLHWEIQCPHCRGIDLQPQKLTDLTTRHTCPACGYLHATNADHDVRVTFSLEERLRQLGSKANDLAFRLQVDSKYGVVSGHQLLTLQIFRTLFPRETLLPGESLQVRRVAILFTDLAGSTALYARLGDTRAYQLVRQHFEQLFQVIDAHRGVVIKTIGDAVMGAFVQTTDAIQAAIAMHQQMQHLNQVLALPPEDQLILKIGIDAGPCISVTLNEQLDYFGTTVNTAARVQATATGQAIAVTEAVMADPQIADTLAQHIQASQSLQLKGLEAPVVVHYL